MAAVGDVAGEELVVGGDLNSLLSSSIVNAGVTCLKADFAPLIGRGSGILALPIVRSRLSMGSSAAVVVDFESSRLL